MFDYFPSEIAEIIFSSLNRVHLFHLRTLNRIMKERIDVYFMHWAKRLITQDSHFAYLPISEVVRYLKRARVNFVVNEDVVKKKVDKFFRKKPHSNGREAQEALTKAFRIIYRNKYFAKIPPFSDVPKFTAWSNFDKHLFIVGLDSCSERNQTLVPRMGQVMFDSHKYF